MQGCRAFCFMVFFCLASSSKVRKFTMYTDKANSVEMAFQGPMMHSASVLDCAITCTLNMSYCHSFFYNKTNGECIPGSWLHSSSSPMDDRHGDIYLNQDYICKGDNGFKYFKGSNDDEKACVFVSSYTATHTEAENYCKASGGQLYVKEPYWKTLLLNLNVLYEAFNETFWLTINEDVEGNSSQRCEYLAIQSGLNEWTRLEPCQLDIYFKFVCELN